MNIFQDAVQITNNLYNEQFKLEAINITVDTTDSFKVQNAGNDMKFTVSPQHNTISII